MYHGEECPWCSFAREVVDKLQAEYKRGFSDGVKAADAEYERQQQIAQQEAKRAKRSDDSKGSDKVDKAVPKDVHTK
jgi:predicted DsbA family dithiol-disulfide isomerase